jgi:YidC/Oxa1 family membrane protein insertase
MLAIANIFQPLIDVFQAILVFYHDHLGVSWGWAIVLLTVSMRALLIPLFIKQYHSMQRLQAHMPEMKAIQAKYKDDKQRQQQEIMKFYQENKVNPFSSCLPLAAQIPVFISLFYMLRQSLRHDICPELNPHLHASVTHACGPTGHAGFLFIHDLTSTATGGALIALLVLYVGTQVASSLISMATSPQAMDKNQRIMMLALPVVFVFFVIRFPAGLLVYWITTNLWTIAQGQVMRWRLGPTPKVATAPAGAAAAVPSRNGAPADKVQEPTGLGGRLLGRSTKPRDGDGDGSAKAPTAVASRGRERGAPPPPPPRKKKKRSGRRR